MYITIGLFLMPVIFFVTLFVVHLLDDLSYPLNMFIAILASGLAAIFGTFFWGPALFMLVVWLIGQYANKAILAVLNKVEDIFVKSP